MLLRHRSNPKPTPHKTVPKKQLATITKKNTPLSLRRQGRLPQRAQPLYLALRRWVGALWALHRWVGAHRALRHWAGGASPTGSGVLGVSVASRACTAFFCVVLAPAMTADKHAGRTAIKTFANDIKLHVYYSIRVSMSSVWLIRELFGWGHWTWRWGNSQRCEKVDYQDWSPYQPRRAPSMVINRRYTIKESIQLKGELTISEGSCVEYHVMASGTRTHGVEIRIQANG
ncbi:hypothetical protein GGX14DRAFT_388520 [Mycena pura]|uniref:Uncharacterized protein n=1 Tax=Mycena pura TaxID=153505 RepID=A0AAD6YH47_9AGAR|nr:hypothetical protein GGX14DRAFT_388520 [Mycena pura]